ncbi:MAG TPA: hypothetical protein VFB54_08815 [Burkholderiales bacterium]|nr:hypothetical protein [Burkholderiales bacterium]
MNARKLIALTTLVAMTSVGAAYAQNPATPSNQGGSSATTQTDQGTAPKHMKKHHAKRHHAKKKTNEQAANK